MNDEGLDIFLKIFLVLFGIFIIFFFALAVLFLIHNGLSEKRGEKQVECYDENLNEINELTCIEDIYCGPIGFMNPDECEEWGK